MNRFKAVQAFQDHLASKDMGDPLFTPSAVKWIVKADEILAGVGIAFFAIVWFAIVLRVAASWPH
jgi:hypothetical protein